MGTVKYTGPVASFHCPTNAEIRSLKVHFSPKQEGSGDPSPENVREIEGWDGIEIYITGENLVPSTITTWYRTYPSGGKYTGANVYSSFAIPIPAGNILVNNQKRSLSYVTLSNNLPASGNSYSNPVTMTNRDSYIWDNSAGYKYLIFTTGRNRETEEAFIENCQLSAYLITKTTYSDYRGQTYPVEFPVVGKNITQWVMPDGMTVTKNYNGNSSWHNGWIPPTSANGKPVTYSVDIDNTNGQSEGYIHIWTIDANGSYVDTTIVSATKIAAGSSGRIAKTITINTDRYKTIIFGLTLAAGATASHPMVEYGSTATTYEPYSSNNTIYGGYVDLVEGKVVQTFKQFSYKWSNGDKQSDVGSYYRRRFPVAGTTTPLSTTLNCCNIAAWYRNYSNNSLHFYNENNYAYVFLPKNTDENTDIILVLELATPIEYPISPTALQTFLGQNNVWSNADYVEVEYDLHETQSILARKQFIVANQPHIVKPAAAPLQNFVTDVPAPLKECKIHFSPVQEGSGDPSPENVRAISGWTGVDITRSEQNILSGLELSYHGSGSSIGADYSGQIMVYGALGNACETYINCSIYRGRQITLNHRPTGNSGGFAFYSEQTSSSFIIGIANRGDTTQGPWTITVPDDENCNYMRFTANPNYIDNVVISLTDETNLFPIDWTATAGTVYGGYADLVKGELVEEWHKIVADGVNVKANSGYSNSNYFGAGIVYINPTGQTRNYTIAGIIQCDSLPINTNTPPFVYVPGAGKLYTVFYLFNTADYPDVTTTAERIAMTNAWLQEHPVTIVYKLQTPIHHTLTPQTLRTLRGTNNIWSNANGDIEVKYWTH